MGISCANVGILNTAYPNDQKPLVGRDLSISLSVFINENMYFGGFFFYLQVIIQFLEGYSRMMTPASRERMSQRFRLLSFIAWFIPLASISFALLSLISIAYPLHSKELNQSHLLGCGVIVLLTGLILCNGLSFLIKELKGVKSSNDLVRICV
jgi:hypothetical protein